MTEHSGTFSQGVLAPARILGMAAMAGALALLIWYGTVVFKNCPLIDDWNFIDRLRAFVSGETGPGYFLERHNGHPSLIGRALFYFDYRIAGLDLKILRWMSVAILVATAALVGRQLVRDLGQAGLALAAPAVTLILSLGHWEALSLAQCIDNFAVNLFAIGAIFLIDAWREKGGAGLLVAAFAAAVLATLSMMQGVLVWPAMALVLLPGRPGGWIVSAGIAVAFVLGMAFVTLGFKADEQVKVAFDPLFTAQGLAVLEGLPFLGGIHNSFLPGWDAAIGVAALLLTLLCCLGFAREPAAGRGVECKYLALVAFGGATALTITLGRHQYTVDQLAASRYATAVLPATVGLWGWLAVRARRRRVAGVALAVLAIIALPGIVVTDAQEAEMAELRGNLMVKMIAVARDGTALTDADAVAVNFFVNPLDAPLIARDVAFLREKRVSFFRRRDPAQ